MGWERLDYSERQTSERHGERMRVNDSEDKSEGKGEGKGGSNVRG